MTLFPTYFNVVEKLMEKAYHQSVLQVMWSKEKNKTFYEAKQLTSETNRVYGLVKMNINFHKLLQPENIDIRSINNFSKGDLRVYNNLINSILK